MGLLPILLLPAALAAQNPVIRCTSSNGTQYSFSLAPKAGSLEIKNAEGTTSHALSEVNLGLAALPKGLPSFYVEETPAAKSIDGKYQMGNRVRTQFFQEGGTPKLALDFTYQHKPLTDLKCKASSGLPVVNPSLTNKVSLAAEPLTLFGGRIDEKGESTAFSLLATETSLLQFLNTPGSDQKEALDDYLEKVGRRLLAVPPPSMETLRKRFTKREKEFLDVILGALRYKYHSDAQRYANWIAEGLKQMPIDWPQVRAGFRSFFKSRGFGTSGMEGFFEDEMKKTLPKVSAYDIAALTDHFSEKEEALVVKIWGAGREKEYRPLKKAYPFLSAMEHNLTRSPASEEGVRKSNFEEFVVALSKLVKDPVGEDPSVRAHFKARLTPLLERLDPKEKKSLATALGEGGNRALSSLR